MTLGSRLKELRREIGLSQEAIGAQGFVSTPGWVKIENGQRQASEKLIATVVDWLAKEKYITAAAKGQLREELLVLKYLGSNSPFVRELAKATASATEWGRRLLADMGTRKPVKAKRGRPAAAPAQPKSGGK